MNVHESLLRMSHPGVKFYSYLHIGKTGGTQIEHVFTSIGRQKIAVRKYGHDSKLAEIPFNRPYFFSIREPVSRFVSGFYSRKRQGRPRINRPWSSQEKVAFEQFKDANDLAESLFKDGELGTKAFEAMKSISHVRDLQSDWFKNQSLFHERQPLWIIRQEALVEDLKTLMELMGLNVDVTMHITHDEVLAHKNNYSDSSRLSELGVANLSEWFKQDIQFYRLCESWISNRQ